MAAAAAAPCFTSFLRSGRATLLKPFVAYNNAAKSQPARVGIATSFLKTAAADLFAQTVVERNDQLDWKRTTLFSVFGLTYLGCWQYHLYNNIFRKWTAPIQSVVGTWGTAPAFVFIDQAIHHPLMYFPAFYSLKGCMEGRGIVESVQKSFEELPENIVACWSVWVPAQLINFSVVPQHLRVPFVSGVSFLWCVILSGLRGASEGDPTAQATCSTPVSATKQEASDN